MTSRHTNRSFSIASILAPLNRLGRGHSRSAQGRARRRHAMFEALESRTLLAASAGQWLFNVHDSAMAVQGPVAQPQGGDWVGHKLQHDKAGNGYFAEEPEAGALIPLVTLPGDAVLWQTYDLSQTFQLQSKPDANQTIYLTSPATRPAARPGTRHSTVARTS